MNLRATYYKFKTFPSRGAAGTQNPIAIVRLPEYPHSKIHVSYKLQRLFECPSTVLSNDKDFEVVVPSAHFNRCMKFERRRKIN